MNRSIKISEQTSNGAHEVSVSVCGKIFKWCIVINDLVDITPCLAEFERFGCDPYEAIDDCGISNLQAISKFNTVPALATSLFSCFIQKLCCVRQELNFACDDANLLYSLLKDQKNAVALVEYRKEGTQFWVEFPVCSSEGVDEYFQLVCNTTPVMICVEVVIDPSNSSTQISTEITIPNVFSCSRHLEINKRKYGKPAKITTSNIMDYIKNAENIIISKWKMRKEFAMELHNMTAVVEYDSTDFSFVGICVRMKSGSNVVLCMVEFRLPCDFPESLPLISVHDLQNSFSSPLDTAGFTACDVLQGMHYFTKQLLHQCLHCISVQAFGSQVST